MKKVSYCSIPALLLASGAAFADTVNTGATVMSKNATPQGYTFMPYITVSTSPYIATKTAYDASDIWSQQSTMNEDLYILKYKQQLQHNLLLAGVSLQQRPIVEISGAIEGMALQTFNSFGGKQSGDINLNTAELDINAMASTWATAFMSFQYDSSPPQTGSRVTNSRLYLSRGFATIGNLDKSPFYFTIGQVYLPFGRYWSYMVTTPLTLSLGRINDRAAILGFYENNFYAQAYLYPGIDSNASDTVFHAGGGNAGYKFVFNPHTNWTIGAGVVSDMTDSQGMGRTGASPPQFPGFTNIDNPDLLPTSNYPFGHTVPGADVHTEFVWGPWAFIAEYLSTTGKFASEDMTFNNKGAQPSAMHSEIEYNFRFRDKPSMVGVSYGHTWQALALNLPQQSADIFVRTSWWKNTVEAIEFRHDDDYSTHNVAVSAFDFGPFTNVGTGKSRNLILAQLGVYF
jgi:hypothetical protein